MPPLKGFSDNPFKSHEDFKTASISLLRALKPYQSPGGARIRLPLATGTHFDDVAAQLEGYARALWAIGTLLHSAIVTQAEYIELIEPYVGGLANGTDPDHAEYWGPVVLRDQRMVEMEIISFALLAAPEAMFHSQSDIAKHNITEWLKTINGKDFPTTNWLWFRVMTNLALTKVCGVPQAKVVDAMKADLDLMERFYLGEGWAADGVWDDSGRQADYYSGSFAIQFSQLIYAKMAHDIDPERCAKFRERAVQFATSFWRYFDTNGAAIPFGRSLTYRFAFAGFWSAAVFANVELPAPLDDAGIVKGILLRHFRWWSTKPDVFNIDGTLTIGFTYPNMYMSEDYNSPQSPYWALKSFLALGLPSTHPFWTCQERQLPLPTDTVIRIKPPMHILCNQPNHHFLLSSGQFCPWPLKATEAKYGKYAYSSNFGFSVPTGPLIQQIAPDSTLAVSKDSGDTWCVPWKQGTGSWLRTQVQIRYAGSRSETVPCLSSTWEPFRDASVQVTTYVVAPSQRWPDWHIRWHKVFVKEEVRNFGLTAVQGGFAVQGRGHKFGEVLPAFKDVQDLWDETAKNGQGFPEGTFQTESSALVCSNAGASGIRNLDFSTPGTERGLVAREDPVSIGEVLKPDANTNLMWQRTLIPTIKVETSKKERTAIFGCAVFALARTTERAEQYSKLDIARLWADPPRVSATESSQEEADKHYFVIDDC